MAAEMMLEQSRLMYLLEQDNRFREELVLNLLNPGEQPRMLKQLAQRLRIDPEQPRVAIVIDIESEQTDISGTINVLQ